MSAHTKGPWSLLGKQAHQQFIEVVHSNLHTPGAASGVISRVTCRVTWQEEQEANARLIAAAPELLEALQAVIRNDAENRGEFGLSINVCKQAIAAIAKATGATK